jgi:hypothetical protein
MYLHIGKNCVIRNTNIIGIFNLERIENTQEFQRLYENLKENNCITDISCNQKNSFILVKEGNKIKGYISNIGPNTIKKREIF